MARHGGGGWVGFSVIAGKAIFAQGELTGNIWMAVPKGGQQV